MCQKKSETKYFVEMPIPLTFCPSKALFLFLLVADQNLVQGFFAGGGGKSSGRIPPTPPQTPPGPRTTGDGSFRDSSLSDPLTATFVNDVSAMEGEIEQTIKDVQLQIIFRGGSTTSSISTQDDKQHEHEPQPIVQSRQTFTVPFWGSASKSLSSLFKSKEKFMEEKLIKELSTMPVEHVKLVSNETIVPPEVVELAARRAGLIGQPLQPESVQEFARALKRWYTREGYVLHALKAANLRPETATAEIEVQEPILSTNPVDIVFCRQLVVDEDTGELLTLRQYKRKELSRGGRAAAKAKQKQSLAQIPNTTLVEVTGRTRPAKIASALHLHPGKPFRWDERRWNAVSSSGIFSSILNVAPQLLEDGTVQLRLVVLEEKGAHVQYGLGRSGYTGSWAGDLNFERANVFGGGESIGFSIARSPSDAEPSIRMCFRNTNFGLDSGYEVEAFSEYIGTKSDDNHVQLLEIKTSPQKQSETGMGRGNSDTNETPTPQPALEDDVKRLDYDDDSLVNRRGTTVRLQNLFNADVLENSAASYSLEQTTTATGLHENTASCTLYLGPVSKQLSFFGMDTRSKLDCKLLAGSRIQPSATKISTKPKQQEQHSPFSVHDDKYRSNRYSVGLWPYVAASATARQIVPLLPTTTIDKRPIVLALLLAGTSSTPSLPRHEAKAQAIANAIRGFSSSDDSSNHDRIATALRGTTELRIPVDIPKFQTPQDGKLVLFGDWLFAKPDFKTQKKSSCLGIGLRKSVQGIPIRYDLCFNSQGQIRHSISIGQDFDA